MQTGHHRSLQRSVILGLTALYTILLLTGTPLGQESDTGPNLDNKAVKKVMPVYPPLAKHNRIYGRVTVKLKIEGDGSVSTAEFLRGNAVFKVVSLEAARQWTFQKSSGGMSGYIAFNFDLSGKAN
jgi:TonB family protein